MDKKCPDCNLEVPFKDKVCIHCGFEFPKHEKPKEEPRQKPEDNKTPGSETDAKAPKG